MRWPNPNTEIVTPRNTNVEVEYRLGRRGGDWLVYLVKKLKLKRAQERAASPTKGEEGGSSAIL